MRNPAHKKRSSTDQDARAISFVLDYVLTVGVLIGIFTILTAALAGNLGENQAATVQYESERAGGEIAAAITQVDSMVENNRTDLTVTEMTVMVDMPRAVDGEPPQLTLATTPTGRDVIRFEAKNIRTDVAYNAVNDVVLDGAVSTSQVFVQWNPDRNAIVITTSPEVSNP